MAPTPNHTPTAAPSINLVALGVALLLAAAAPSARAFPSPVIPLPIFGDPVAGPPAPAVGVRALAESQSKALDGCTSAWTGVIDGRNVASCQMPVYINDQSQSQQTTPGTWATSRARTPLPSNIGVIYEPATPDFPWWWGDNANLVQGAAARAYAGPKLLRAGAFALDTKDEGWSWAPGTSSPFSHSTESGHHGLREFADATARATAVSVDRFTVSGTGPMKMNFILDGIHESGYSGPNPGGGSFEFVLALYDRSKLSFYQFGDFVIPHWSSPQDYRLAGVVYNATAAPTPSYWQLLGEEGFRDMLPLRVSTPQAEGTPYENQFVLEFDATDGQELTLAMLLRTTVSGFDGCDDKPGDGINASCPGSLADRSTLVDFSSSMRLASIELGGNITGLTSVVGADYMAVVVPEPGTWVLWLAGVPAVAHWVRRRARRQAESAAALPA